MRADPHQRGLYLTEGHRWVYRRVIPAELRPAAKRLFGVRTEFLISLSTHHRDDALARLDDAAALAVARRGVESLRVVIMPQRVRDVSPLGDVVLDVEPLPFVIASWG
ncbi:MAG: hypothetical protein K2X00_18560 [Nitrospiraceae bacterium]|nr:hypothetical protein [Nitrospiraceae bacterium]